MKRILTLCAIAAAVVGVTLTGTTLIASAQPTAAPPPGGPAPKALAGTYTTKLTHAEIVSAPRPEFFPSQPRWRLVILNSAVGNSPRALGLNPVGSGGPAVPFGVSGKRINLQCQTEGGVPTRGHSTFTWSLNGRTLTFKLVSQPCKSSTDRNTPVVLTSEPWHKVR
jgi:hypothetical protein